MCSLTSNGRMFSLVFLIRKPVYVVLVNYVSTVMFSLSKEQMRKINNGKFQECCNRESYHIECQSILAGWEDQISYNYNDYQL